MFNEIEHAEMWLEISIPQQRLYLHQGKAVLWQVQVSTAANGAGEASGSEQTPRGWHQVRAKIGDGQPENAVFVGRRPTGEICTAELQRAHSQRDWILSRILWLSGLEPGKNRLGSVDTMRRYIYLHGTPDDVPLGQAGSHGCIRMRNSDIIYLFDQIEAGTKVWIHE